MELTLKRLLEHAEFKRSRGKGYDPTEVDEFMDRAAVMAGKVELQLTQAIEAARTAGGPSADPQALEAEIERRVAERLAEAPQQASAEEDSAQVVGILQMAQRTADETVKSAKESAQRMVSEATAQAEALVAEASAEAEATRAQAAEEAESTRAQAAADLEREHREARERLAGEILELEGVREALRSDVSVLERHVEEQRSQLGSTIAELQQILDDPAGFRMAPPPPLSDPVVPDFTELDGQQDEAPGEVAAAEEADAPAAGGAPEEPDESQAGSIEGLEGGLDAGDLGVEDNADEAAAGDGGTVGPLLSFGEVDHAQPGFDEPSEGGPPTEPVAAVDAPDAEGADDAEADPFMTELRKAITDDEPLGPRDHEESTATDTLFGDDDRRTWRFGRRR